MPDALEFPRMLSAVVPLVGRERFPRFRRSIVNEHVTFALRHPFRRHQVLRLCAGRIPRFAAVIGTLNYLPEPGACLRLVDSVGISWRNFLILYLQIYDLWTFYLI